MIWTLFDYGVGNLHSLDKALQRAGAKTAITRDVEVLAEADVAVLPGVGAFGHVMESLSGSEELLRDRHRAGRPILGICIGHQILHEASDEAPGTPGLGILPGPVKALRPDAGKIPHMGWNTVEACQGLMAGLDDQYVYYVHSFAAPVGYGTQATTTYGEAFSAVEQDGRTIGIQFHPEKSSRTGHRILEQIVQHMEHA